MIFFDCEKMKHPYTGLFYFCENLAYALSKESKKHDWKHKLGFFIPKQYLGKFGNEHPYIRQYPIYKKIFVNPKIQLWHSAHQQSPYMPIKTPIIQTIHDLNFLYTEKRKSKQTKCLNFMNKRLKRISHIVAISQSVKQDILNHLEIRDIPIDVIYNGCNIYHGLISEPRRKPKRPFLLTIGTILPRKNFHVLPCLLVGNDYELVIVGIQYKYVFQIMQEARDWGVADRIYMTGSIPESEKHWYLQHCIAFLFPSIAEGFGLPVIEAMQYGKPVFLSTHTCLPEIGGKYAYYFNYDFERNAMQNEFNNGITDFYSNNNLHQKENTLKAHALEFSWENAAQQYWQIYNKILENTNANDK